MATATTEPTINTCNRYLREIGIEGLEANLLPPGNSIRVTVGEDVYYVLDEERTSTTCSHRKVREYEARRYDQGGKAFVRLHDRSPDRVAVIKSMVEDIRKRNGKWEIPLTKAANKVYEVFPNAVFEEDLTGQVIIYTDMQCDKDEVLRQHVREEERE